MENRDRDKMSQRSSSTQAGDINRGVSQDQSKSDSSASFGQKIGKSENSLNEPSSRTSGSVGSRGMESGSKSSGSSDLGSSSDVSSIDKDKSSSTWGDSGKDSQGSRH